MNIPFSVILFSICVPFVPVCRGWLAFADQDQTPTIPGTAMSGDLILPNKNDLNNCIVAATSLRNMQCARTILHQPAILFVLHHGKESSAIRVVKKLQNMWFEVAAKHYNAPRISGILNTQCPEVLAQLRTLNIAKTNLLSQDVLSSLKSRCVDSNATACSDNEPCAENLHVSLAPQECPSFRSSHGENALPFVTWHAVHHQSNLGTGHLGGLGLYSDDGYTTWACIRAENCTAMPNPDDSACFRYHHVLGEFHFWDWNSRLELVQPTLPHHAHFCANYVSTLIDADSGLPVDNGGLVRFVFREEWNGSSIAAAGTVPTRVSVEGSCAPVRLKRNSIYWLEIDAGPSYLPFYNWFKTIDSDTSVAVALRPTSPRSADVLGPLHIDMYRCDGTAPAELCVASIALVPSVLCAPLDVPLGNREFTLSFTATLPAALAKALDAATLAAAGTNQIWHFFVRGGGGTAAVGCSVLSINLAALCRGGPRLSIVAGKYGGLAAAAAAVEQHGWWHAFDLITAAGTDNRGALVELRVGVVDSPAQLNTAGPVTAASSAAPYRAIRRLFTIAADGQCGTPFARLIVRTWDAATGQALAGASATVDGTQYILPSESGAGVGSADDGRDDGFSGVGYVEEGDRNMTVEAPGYATRIVDLGVVQGQLMVVLEVHLVPLAQGLSWIVLRRPASSSNSSRRMDSWSHLFVLPVGTRHADGDVGAVWVAAAERAAFTDRSGQPPYLWWGLGGASGCVCANEAETVGPCVSTCGLSVLSMPAARMDLYDNAQRRGNLRIADHQHSELQTASLAKLLPGYYPVYLAARGPDAGAGFGLVSDIDAEVWLGDGAGGVDLVETVAVRGSVTSWVYLGLLRVAPARTGACMGRIQVGTGTCYAWFGGGGSPAAYPLDFPFRSYVVALRPQPFSSGCVAVSNLRYRAQPSAGCHHCGGCNKEWSTPTHSGALGPFTPVVVNGMNVCSPNEGDPRFLELWLGFDQTGSTSTWVNYTLTINGPGFLEGRLQVSLPHIMALEGGGMNEDVCAASRVDKPAVELLADAAIAQLTLSILHSQVKVGNYRKEIAAQQVQELRSVTARVYVGGGCSCWDQVLMTQSFGACNFTGTALGGSAMPLPNASWTVTDYNVTVSLNLTALSALQGFPLCEGVYWVLLESPLFFQRVVRTVLGSGGSIRTAQAVLVGRCTLCVRVVLEWGGIDDPDDLDLHILNIEPQLSPPPAARWKPEGCQDANEVYWTSEGPKFGGVILDVDFTEGYGQETATFGPEANEGVYHVVVSVFTNGNEDDPAVLGGGPLVSIYGEHGLIAIEMPPTAVQSAQAWWVGTVNRSSAGYTYASVGNATTKFDRCQAGDSIMCTAQCSSL